jgi:hypothetical protein
MWKHPIPLSHPGTYGRGDRKPEKAHKPGSSGAMQEETMRATARTPRRSATRQHQQAKVPRGPALAEPLDKRQLEQSVSWTGRERLRCLWYRLRLTVQEMNYATRRLVELQMRLP